MNGVNEIRCAQSTLSSSPKLSSAERVVYHICVRVWKINNVVTDSEGVGRLTPGIDSPGFEHGDELLYELASLYSQTDSIHRLSLAESP